MVPDAGEDESSGSFEMRCDELQPVRCDELLRADSSALMVAVARKHGEQAHGYTPLWYDKDRLTAMAAAVASHLG